MKLLFIILCVSALYVHSFPIGTQQNSSEDVQAATSDAGENAENEETSEEVTLEDQLNEVDEDPTSSRKKRGMYSSERTEEEFEVHHGIHHREKRHADSIVAKDDHHGAHEKRSADEHHEHHQKRSEHSVPPHHEKRNAPVEEHHMKKRSSDGHRHHRSTDQGIDEDEPEDEIRPDDEPEEDEEESSRARRDLPLPHFPSDNDASAHSNSVAVRVKRVSRAGSSHKVRTLNKNRGNSKAGETMQNDVPASGVLSP
uniref:Uncharacterized protein n=1 Tax=Caenorhabditis japonica TaxID=281687 RepID=A0A8R1HZX9_CAEJA